MRKTNILLLIGFFLMSVTALKGEGVVYVASGANGNGTSWSDAMGDVQTAINQASTAGKEVWIKEGLYRIGATITLKNGVNVYGSFSGSEQSVSERPMTQDGEAWEFQKSTVLDGDYSCRIMQSKSDVKDKVVVDGLKFTLANGDATDGYFSNQGGAIFIAGNVEYRNCIISENTASQSGGGVVMIGGTLRQCLIEKNTAGYSEGEAQVGGGVHIKTESEAHTANVINCVIRANKGFRGAGMFVQGPGMTSVNGTKVYNNVSTEIGSSIFFSSNNIEMYNCLVYNNSSLGANTNAMYISGGKIYNCTIVNNVGIIYFARKENSYEFMNNIIWGNKSLDGTFAGISSPAEVPMLNFSNNATDLAPSVIESKNWGEIKDNIHMPMVTNAPHFRGNVTFAGAAGSDPDKEYELEYIDLSILQTSPCYNAGKTIEAVTHDIVGIYRPQAGAYDIGAYEFDHGEQSGINYAITDQYSLVTVDGGILLKGADSNLIVSVYTISGNLVFSQNTDDSEIFIPLNRGVYIIKVGHSVKKVIV